MTQGSNTLIYPAEDELIQCKMSYDGKNLYLLTTAQAEPQKQKHAPKDIVMCWIPKGIRLPKFSVTVSFILAIQTICLKKMQIIWNI